MTQKRPELWPEPGPRFTGLASRGTAFAPVLSEDEFLHPPAKSGHHSATETSYFGFNIPEERVNGEIYMWFHPVLGVMSASVYIWRGYKKSTLACEYVNHYSYLPMPVNGIADYEIADIGLKIRVLDPLKSMHIAFEDPQGRGVSFEVTFEAIMPAAGRPGGGHFTQAMRTRGVLNLYGEQLPIDGYFSRDHSWGEERRETGRQMPPMSWMVGVIDDSFAFHCVAFDSAESTPEWLERYPIAPGANLAWGYVFRDGALHPVVSASKRTIRDPDGLTPRLLTLDIEDAGGERHAIRGEVMASMPWQTWQNMNVYFCQTRWECARGVAWGDLQDVQMNDFIHAYGR
jgi:hypothetical protein